MNYNQYYGAQANPMPLPGNQSYYQPSVMSPHIQNSGINQPPQMNHPIQPVNMGQAPMNQALINQAPIHQSPINQAPMNRVPINQAPMNPAQMNQSPSMNQYGQNHFQYGMNFAPNTPSGVPSPQYSPGGIMNQHQTVPVPVAPNYPQIQQNHNSLYQPQNTAPYTNQYPFEINSGNNSQNNFSEPMATDSQFRPTNHQQNTYPSNQSLPLQSTTPTNSTQPAYGGKSYTNQAGQHFNKDQESAQPSALPKEEPRYKNTNVIGHYKCSDFPNLFTGAFRYAGTPVQRKPFTIRGDTRPATQPNPNTGDRRSAFTLNKFGKRWELRGGKYYGCFTSRTNGLQDTCPKAKCKLCPHEKKKK
ncbi:hypothetical protein HHI36_010818 [Cryptolaemus montrouzieri]|uniref:Uncharacterized protein n=1 Tax=Cryptolaemus montrouzieri TaxID=559131 RepID=A0ABD2MJX5_9CUCU